jgi:hypothetical protein
LTANAADSNFPALLLLTLQPPLFRQQTDVGCHPLSPTTPAITGNMLQAAFVLLTWSLQSDHDDDNPLASARPYARHHSCRYYVY